MDAHARLKAEVLEVAREFRAVNPGFDLGALKGLGHRRRALIHSRTLATQLANAGLVTSKSIRRGKQAYENVAIAPAEVLYFLAQRLQLPEELFGAPIA